VVRFTLLLLIAGPLTAATPMADVADGKVVVSGLLSTKGLSLVVAEGTEAEGSAVALVTVPATLTCQDCGLTAETTDVLAVCPGCGGENVEITGGDEMTLESVTYEPARTGG